MVMPTVTDQCQADQAVALPRPVTGVELQTTDIEIFQQMALRAKDSQADPEYDLINKAKIYTLLVAEVEQVVQDCVHRIIATTEKSATAVLVWLTIFLVRYYIGVLEEEVHSITVSLGEQHQVVSVAVVEQLYLMGNHVDPYLVTPRAAWVADRL